MRSFRQSAILGGLLLGLVAGISPSAYANVYATNIKLNGSLTNVSAAPGQSVAISYILNEPASMGVTIDVSFGANLVRTLHFTAGDPGTLRGPNTITWDGKDNQSNSVAIGVYSISITAASSGYTNWTHITSDDETGTFAYDGRGIAVDRNPFSAYYGRVYVANASDGGTADSVPGILKLNADASGADEGSLSAGQDGYGWQGQGLSPWKLEVSADDYLYVNDLAGGGQVLRWDPTISSNALVSVLRLDNQPPGANLSGLAVVGNGAGTRIFMSDRFAGFGVVQWSVTADGTCATNDPGETVIGLGDSLNLGPYDVAIDGSGNFYNIQSIESVSDVSPRVFQFRALDPSTNAGIPETVAEWAIGSGDDTYGGASGIAVDATGTYVAVSFLGVPTPGGLTTNGSTRIFYATNGSWVAELDLGVVLSGEVTHQDTDCAWDAVGNVYYIDNWVGHWRAVSPPGTNQASTLAAQTITIQTSTTTTIEINSITLSGDTVTMIFTGAAADLPSAFTLLSSAGATGSFTPAAGANFSSSGPGVFQVTIPASGPVQFYRIQR